MKIIKIVTLLLVPFFIQSMDNEENEKKVINSCSFYTINKGDTKRAPLFQHLNLQLSYKRLLYRPVSHEEIEKLKNELITVNKEGKRAEIKDLQSCIRYYNVLYKNHKNKENNSYFLDAILPVLFKDHDLPQTHAYKEEYGTSQELLITGNVNSYLLSSLIYPYGISIKSFASYHFGYQFIPAILSTIQLTEDLLKEDTQNKIDYLKAIFTPPASWIKESQKNVMPTIKTFIQCLYRLKKLKPGSFTVPKRLLITCILPFIIKNTVEQKTIDRCNTVTANVQESIECMRKGGYHEGDNGVTDFLYNELGQWLEEKTNICQMIYNSMFKR